MATSEASGGEMAPFATTALAVPATAVPHRRRSRRALAALRNLCDGVSRAPSNDWSARAVPDIAGFWRPPPGDRQEAR
jgi:hypothetical protein